MFSTMYINLRLHCMFRCLFTSPAVPKMNALYAAIVNFMLHSWTKSSLKTSKLTGSCNNFVCYACSGKPRYTRSHFTRFRYNAI
jgi:hypothetical protein